MLSRKVQSQRPASVLTGLCGSVCAAGFWVQEGVVLWTWPTLQNCYFGTASLPEEKHLKPLILFIKAQR